jgi:Flp pilus assembly protein CpaB
MIVLMLVAVGCGLVAAFLASSLVNPAPPQLVMLPVAAHDLRPGSALTEPDRQLVIRPFLAESVPPGAIRNVEELRGRVLARPVEMHHPLTARDINQNNVLFIDAPPGTFAVTLRVNPESAHAGFIVPGSRVDLLCTVTDPQDQRRTLTRTFIQNVLVLAVNTESQPPPDRKVMTAPATMTLAVELEDAERLVWAKDKGQINVVLRPPGYHKVLQTRGAFNPFASGDPKDEPAHKITVLLARQHIMENTMIDDPARWFITVEYPVTLAQRAITADEQDALKGKVVRHMVPAGYPITESHLVMQPPDRDDISIMVVQEGANPPKKYEYHGGKIVGYPGLEPPARRTPAKEPQR